MADITASKAFVSQNYAGTSFSGSPASRGFTITGGPTYKTEYQLRGDGATLSMSHEITSNPRGPYSTGKNPPLIYWTEEARFDNLQVDPAELWLLAQTGQWGAFSTFLVSGDDTFRGSAGNDVFRSGDGDDYLAGNSGSDLLYGDAGSDTLDGGKGADVLAGGTGDDQYIVRAKMAACVENAGEGTDEVLSYVTYTLGANVENLTLLDGDSGKGAKSVNGTGNGLGNVITGNRSGNLLSGRAGNDTLYGGGGADTLAGGAGDDVFIIDDLGSTIQEKANEGKDEVRTSVTTDLSQWANVENIRLMGNGNINASGNLEDNSLHGNGGNNVLSGSGGNDTFHGGGGTDTLIGGAGDDIYGLATGTETIVENDGEGNDTLQTAATISLANYTWVESVEMTGSGNTSITGNQLANRLVGNSGNNTLNGGGGTDTLIGGAGDDVYIVTGSAEMIVEKTGEGVDLVQTFGSFSIANNEEVEGVQVIGTSNASIVGNAKANLLIGNGWNNSIEGGEGADTLRGGGGYDTLTGGEGADVFGIGEVGSELSPSVLRITDYQQDQDMISLRGVSSSGPFTYFADGSGRETISPLNVLSLTDQQKLTDLSTLQGKKHVMIFLNKGLWTDGGSDNTGSLDNRPFGYLYYDGDANGLGVPTQIATIIGAEGGSQITLSHLSFFMA